MLITEGEMSEITHLSSPSPALALVEKRRTDLMQTLGEMDKNQLYLALDSIRDPGNFGTILRIADWFGMKAIFASPDSVDLYNSKVIQASMGAIFNVPVYYANIAEVIDILKIPVWGASLSGVSIYKSQLSSNGIIIIGNEAKGISTALQEKIDRLIIIPSFQSTEVHSADSLNAAVATAIICSEFRRRFQP
jgi:TrmH family RNA methyltransferase